MAQTVIVQEQALNAAQARIANLEQQLASRPAGGGGFLSGLFGGGGQPQHRPPQPDNMQGMMPPGSRFGGPGVAPGMQGMAPGRSRGGFLAGAAQTAMGVAGGVLLGNMIANAVGGGDGKTAEAGQSNPSAEPAAASGDEGDFGEDLGGDFGEDVKGHVPAPLGRRQPSAEGAVDGLERRMRVPLQEADEGVRHCNAGYHLRGFCPRDVVASHAERPRD